jgi:hypothetical protein
MKRRNFLAASAGAFALNAQQGAPKLEPIEKATPQPGPSIALNHLGFRPDAKKVLIIRTDSEIASPSFTLREVGSVLEPFSITRPLVRDTQSDFAGYTGDFSDVTRDGMYQITANGERSVPFFIRPDVWSRTLPKVVGYHKYQRCGVAVPGVHPACHLDDARRRADGKHIDVSGGGWHDAGDLRKWMDVTMLNAIGLLHVARNLGAGWNADGSGLAPILEEVKWGNRFFLKMQDSDGLVFADVGGGVNGDNSDNHWTDNIVGTSDDRYVNTAKSPEVQAMFVYLQAMVALAFLPSDPLYSHSCSDAAVRCWHSAHDRSSSTLLVAAWLLASVELWRATGQAEYRDAAVKNASELMSLQVRSFVGGQHRVRGFWKTSAKDATPYCHAVFSALPGIALAQFVAFIPDTDEETQRARDSIAMHIDDYVTPLVARSVFRIVPYGLFLKTPTKETYRSLAGSFTYRFFMPTRKEFWWLGINSHLECYAVFLVLAAQVLTHRESADLAYRQLEWVLGANPFGSCLMTGEGIRNPYPHSRYVGLIPGGIMNGIAGNADDVPILDLSNQMDWRTVEYWSPQNAWYEWAVSALEMRQG